MHRRDPTAPMLVGAFGRTAAIEATDDTARRVLAEVLGDLRVDAPSEGGAHRRFVLATSTSSVGGTLVADAPAGWLLAVDDTVIARPKDRANALGWLIWALNRHVIDGVADTELVLHAAGAVAPGSDSHDAVLLPADSGAGKSTLVLGLLRRGWRYLSDEALALDTDDATRRVRGYAKPVTVEAGSFALFDELRPERWSDWHAGRWQLPASAITSVADTARPAAVVLPRYEPDAAPRLTRLSPSEGLVRLSRCAFSPATGTVRLEQVQQLAPLVETIGVHELVSGDLDGAVDLVTELLGRN